MKFTSGGMNSIAEFIQGVFGDKWNKDGIVKISQKDIDNTPDEDPAFYQGLLNYEISCVCQNNDYDFTFKSPKGITTEIKTSFYNDKTGWNFYHENGFEIK